MATLNEIVFDLALIVRGGKLSNSENISLRQIEFWIHNTRSMLIQRDIEKRRSISDNIIQSLGCIDVEVVDASSCCGINIGCDIVRSKVKLPSFIETAHKDMITRVGSVNLIDAGFTIIPYQRASFVGSNRYTMKGIYAFLLEKYIYILGKNARLLDKINVQGLIENPTQISNFKSCDGTSCYDENSDYPISSKHIELLKQMILQTNLKIETVALTDNTANAKHDLEQNIT